ncbi:MAG TPA: ornithine cyclodeaminase family protein [Bryobacteraceae bacterium]|nr:ornithine cyclodeaminase family protein [Bryobacteraceae bacterium]
MLYLTESDVRRFLPINDCISQMRTAFADLAAGKAINQPRRRLVLPTRSTLHYMAAANGVYFGAKIYSTNPKSGARFLLLLYRAEDGAPLALLEADYLGQIRTGATSGLATDLLARPDAETAAIVGSGFQARSQLEALASVRRLRRVRVWSRSAEKRQAFAVETSAQLGLAVEATDSAEQAIQGADIVTTATNSAEPVLESAWVADGAHVNAMGSNRAQRRELPPDLLRRAAPLVVDSVEQSRMESGDLLLANFLPEEWMRVVELEDVVSGQHGRRHPEDITIFKSNGLAVEDVAAAGLVYERAVEAGTGSAVHS